MARPINRLIWTSALSALGAGLAVADDQRVPLRINVPTPSSIIYHPWQHLKDPAVEWPHHPDKSGLTVPAGTENVAHHMPVTRDRGPDPVIGSLNDVTDGDKCGGEGCWVELPPGVRWIQIDLQASTPIFAIAMWQSQQYDRAYRDVVVQVSDDPDFRTAVTTLFNNDADNSAGLGKGTDREYADTVMGRLIDAKGTRARYVRLYANGSHHGGGRHVNRETYWSEVEVYGTPTAAGRAFQDERREQSRKPLAPPTPCTQPAPAPPPAGHIYRRP